MQTPWKRLPEQVIVLSVIASRVPYAISESRSLGVQRKVGGKLHLKLNICLKPFANKYDEGKMQRTLKRVESVELAGREVSWTSFAWWHWRMTLAFTSESVLLFALCVRTMEEPPVILKMLSPVTGFTSASAIFRLR